MKLPTYWSLTVMLNGGHALKLKCKEFSFTPGAGNTGYTGYRIVGAKEKFAFSPSSMIGWTATHHIGFI